MNSSQSEKPLSSPTPLFIISPMQRSGTNFLQQLLCLHPKCNFNEISGEDWIAQRLHLLDTFISETMENKNMRHGHKADDKKRYRKELGRAILNTYAYLVSDPPHTGYTVFKTPHPYISRTFFQYFPDAKVIALVRDGRSTIASWLQASFCNDTNFTSACYRWKEGAKFIQQISKNNPGTIKLVNYESLILSRTETLNDIFDFLNLPQDTFNYESATSYPVINSSFLAGDLKNSMKPVPLSNREKHICRYDGWKKGQHTRFWYIAHEEMYALGYNKVEDSKYASPIFPLWHKWLSLCWHLRFIFLFLKKGLCLQAAMKTMKLHTLEQRLWLSEWINILDS